MRFRARACLGVLALVAVLVLLAGRLQPTLPRNPGERFLQGQVCTRHQPLAGATVRLKGSADAVKTDSAGRFVLPLGLASTRRVTAWKEGHFIAGAPLDANPFLLTLQPLPQEDNKAYKWVASGPDPKGRHNCANCHADIHREWRHSGHARAATGRHFRDLYAGTAGWSLLEEHPLGAGVCAACHAPTVPVGDPARFDLTRVSGVAAEGVHCDYCHKVAGDGAGQFGLSHGRYKLKLLRPTEGQLFFGPLDDVDRGEDAYTAFYKDSRYCAACHEGIVFGVHVYSTYSEWLDSPARQNGLHCQDCHMKPTGRMSNIAPGKGGIERDPWTLGNHRLFAGSRADMLRKCLRLSATLTRQDARSRAEVTIRVEGAGHRVPTGFIDRHLILVVEGLRHDGKAVAALSGPKLPAAAGPELAGRPGWLYAKLLRDEQGRSPVPFWREAAEPTDTRLHPGRSERVVFEFPPDVVRLRLRLLYRRFWQEVVRSKGWPDRDIVVVERVVP
jgi:hypothetical protein